MTGCRGTLWDETRRIWECVSGRNVENAVEGVKNAMGRYK